MKQAPAPSYLQNLYYFFPPSCRRLFQTLPPPLPSLNFFTLLLGQAACLSAFAACHTAGMLASCLAPLLRRGGAVRSRGLLAGGGGRLLKHSSLPSRLL